MELKKEDLRCCPDHPLFKTDRWGILLRCDSAYFAGDTNSYITREDFDLELKYSPYLTIRSNLKNYDLEIELFLDWISQYVRYPTGECAGYFRCEECSEPTLIYFNYFDEIKKYMPVGLLDVRVGSESRVRPLDRYLPKSWHEWKKEKGN